jgi:hypothetical protein
MNNTIKNLLYGFATTTILFIVFTALSISIANVFPEGAVPSTLNTSILVSVLSVLLSSAYFLIKKNKMGALGASILFVVFWPVITFVLFGLGV